MRDKPVETIPLIGERQSQNLQNLGIYTVRDLLFHIPYKYKDTSEIIPITQLVTEREGTILAEVISIQNIWTRNRKVITKAQAKDNSGIINIVWFNQSFLTKNIKPGDVFLFEGKMSKKSNDFSSPSYEKFGGNLKNQTHLGKITPFYHETAGISSKWLRARINWLKDKIPEIVTDKIPKNILEKYQLLPLKEAIEDVHFAESFDQIQKARKRLEFDEMLNISLRIVERKYSRMQKKSPKIKWNKTKVKLFIGSLPFNLTEDQEKAVHEILKDMEEEKPMNRLLNGDVGSGKTVVASIAAYNALLEKHSTIIMVPTTILAKQHYKTLKKLFREYNVKIQLRISKKKIESSQDSQIIIGTHALLYNTQYPENTGLVVVDEQHRFGVNQRTKISTGKDKDSTPHYLTMTATPIPRTLTSILYGDMDISLILNKPKDRIPIKTYLVPTKKREDCYISVANKIEDCNFQEQAFIIFPLIEESAKIDAKAATVEYEKISETLFKNIKTALLHGKMKEEEKNRILKDFKDKKIHALFSTSVIEVGIDMPNATMMVIESAERFGLAQLHQFRGRIGRGDKQSYCFVIGERLGQSSKERLSYFCKNNSGFDVAEFDLKSRGPGEVYGLRQTGIPILKVGDITNFELLHQTRDIAEYLVKNYDVEEIKENLFR
jgi:ATP-dependent DNA helicase RecG